MLEVVEFLLDNRTWSKSCLRLNIAKPEGAHTGITGFKRANILSGLVHNHNTQDKLLRAALSKNAPSGGTPIRSSPSTKTWNASLRGTATTPTIVISAS